MEPEQYEIMAQAEQQHWWYQGLRDVIRQLLEQPDLGLPKHPSILDAGCGTGGNLRYLHDLLAPSYLGGFDVSELAVAHARRLCPAADIYTGDMRSPVCHRPSLDLILSCDVLYTVGLDACLGGLRRLVHALAPGGLFIVHVPAYRWLTSDHDRAVHTRERYVLSQVRQLLHSLGMACLRASYRLCCLLPLVALKRAPSFLGLRPETATSDLKPTAPWLNRLLFRMLYVENLLIARGVCLPWGSSIVAVGQKVTAYNEVRSLLGPEVVSS